MEDDIFNQRLKCFQSLFQMEKYWFLRVIKDQAQIKYIEATIAEKNMMVK